MTKPSFLHVLKSVLSAFIGVQSDKNREVDFTRGSLSMYIFVGAIATLVFIFTIVKIAAFVASP